MNQGINKTMKPKNEKETGGCEEKQHEEEEQQQQEEDRQQVHAILTLDLQNEFMKPGGKLHDEGDLKQIIEQMRER